MQTVKILNPARSEGFTTIKRAKAYVDQGRAAWRTCHTCALGAASSSGAARSINGWRRWSVLKVVCFLDCQKSGPSERRRTIKCEDGIKKVVCRRERERRVGPGLGCGATHMGVG